jgi:hypothetical protein
MRNQDKPMDPICQGKITVLHAYNFSRKMAFYINKSKE